MSTGPLGGVTVIEVGGIGPGPFAGMLLADFGAEVIRVDRPGATPPLPIPAEEGLFNRGKKMIALDLKQPAAVDALLTLVERADALIEGFRPGVAERLGLGPDQCQARNPALVYGRMTGWGQDGPWAQMAGHDVNYISVTGALHAIGPADGPPQIPLNLLGDFGGGGTYLSDACVSPVVSLREAADHPQISARGTLRLDGGRVEPAPAPRFSGSPSPRPAPPARCGAHTSEILSRAGVDVATLLASGAAVQSQPPLAVL